MFQEKEKELYPVQNGKRKIWAELVQRRWNFTFNRTGIYTCHTYTDGKSLFFFANRGWAYDPHVVSEIVDAYSGNREKVKINLETLKEYPKSFYETINDALVATVSQDNGTTKTLRNPHVKVAAKSGSAQNPHSKLTHAWVAGYFSRKSGNCFRVSA